MSVKNVSVWPVNELGEIVTQIGDGTSDVVGVIDSSVLPTEDNNRIPIVISNLDEGILDLPLTGFSSNAGLVSDGDNILTALQKLDGNIILNKDLSTAGTNTNDSAAAGRIGQFVTSTVASGAAISLTTDTAANVTSISLTAGDWDVTGVVDYALSAATSSKFTSALSVVSATIPSQIGDSVTGLGTDPVVSIPLVVTLLSDTYTPSLPTVRVSLGSTHTVYLVAKCAFSAGSVDVYGTIRARRVR